VNSLNKAISGNNGENNTRWISVNREVEVVHGATMSRKMTDNTIGPCVRNYREGERLL
jgi:hypothetical protein